MILTWLQFPSNIDHKSITDTSIRTSHGETRRDITTITKLDSYFPPDEQIRYETSLFFVTSAISQNSL